MKKTLAFILVCALLVSAFALTAFAGTDRWGTENGQGEDAFTGGSSQSPINVKVDTVVHKYAVDVTYTTPTYTLPGMTWDVNNHKYVLDTDANPFAPINLTVGNHSDLPIYSQIVVADNYVDADNDFIGYTYDANKNMIEKASWTAADNTGAVTTASYTITPASADMVQTVNFFYTKGFAKGTTVPVANYTIIISKN